MPEIRFKVPEEVQAVAHYAAKVNGVPPALVYAILLERFVRESSPGEIAVIVSDALKVVSRVKVTP